MKVKTDEAELVGRALEICRTKHANALSRRAELNKEIEQLERKIKNYEQLISASGDSPISSKISPNREYRTPRNQIRANQSEYLFIDLLRARDGVGATLKELIALTGTSVATAYRAIKRLETQGKVRRDDNARWHWMRK
jgi:uncharacterized membrane protein